MKKTQINKHGRIKIKIYKNTETFYRLTLTEVSYASNKTNNDKSNKNEFKKWSNKCTIGQITMNTLFRNHGVHYHWRYELREQREDKVWIRKEDTQGIGGKGISIKEKKRNNEAILLFASLFWLVLPSASVSIRFLHVLSTVETKTQLWIIIITITIERVDSTFSFWTNPKARERRSNPTLLWSRFTLPCDRLRKRAPFSQPIGSKTKKANTTWSPAFSRV